jgi:hypothetical protein
MFRLKMTGIQSHQSPAKGTTNGFEIIRALFLRNSELGKHVLALELLQLSND